MSARRAQPRPEWTAPATEELLVLERQIRDAIAEAEAVKTKPYGDDGWSPWITNLGDLIGRAFGPESPQANSFQRAGGIIADSPDQRDYSSPAKYGWALVDWRNGKIAKYVAAAQGAVKAVGQELERRGAQPKAPGLVARDLAVVKSAPLRAIAARDYEELRAVAGGTLKAGAILAGSVIEAVLYDALERNGFTPKQLDRMDFVELIDEAATAKIIAKRTQKAAHAVRDVRNYVHPAVELREGRLRKVDADAAIALMNMVLEDIK